MGKENGPLRGKLTALSVAHLFFKLGKAKSSGCLRLKKDSAEQKILFMNGNIAITQDLFPEKDFLKFLIQKKRIRSPDSQKCEDLASQNKTSAVKTLIERRIIKAADLWKHMESFAKESFFPLFDWPQGEYVFDAESVPIQKEILLAIPSVDLAVEGIRRMKNEELFKKHLPAEEESLRVVSSDVQLKVNLIPHEKYLLRLLSFPIRLKDIYQMSELGEKETQRALYGFLCMEIVESSEGNSLGLLYAESFKAEIRRILTIFQNKCTYIYKYISKEAGPVALNVLEKSLEDIRSSLPPFFHTLSLDEDGRIELPSSPKLIQSLNDKQFREEFFWSLNEILAAEVLAVKKTLGNGHESIVVNNLEKINE